MDKKKRELILSTYYNPETGYSGVEKMYQRLHKQGVTRANIKSILDQQEIVQVNKKKIGKPGSFVAPYPLYQFQVDLIYLENTHLNKASYGLTCIDIFTRRGDVELMSRRDTPNVLKAMKAILKRMGNPEHIYSDEGSEFISTEFKNYFKDNNIEQVLTLAHAPFVERFNRTIKELLHKYLQATKSKTIVNVLPKVLSNYNNSYHKYIGMTPNEVNKSNEMDVLERMLTKAHIKRHPQISVGDTVRVRLKKKQFEKSYHPRYSKTIYTVTKKDGNSYKVDGLNRSYLRSFIQKVQNYENPDVAPDNEGSREAQLKAIRKLRSSTKADVKESEPVARRTRSSNKN